MPIDAVTNWIYLLDFAGSTSVSREFPILGEYAGKSERKKIFELL